MPQLPYSIELHDSEIAGIERLGEDVQVVLSPAYVHEHGKGWLQDATLTVRSAQIETSQTPFPVAIADGQLLTTRGPYDNLLILPLAVDGPVTIYLTLVTGNEIKIAGMGCDVELTGKRAFLEDCERI